MSTTPSSPSPGAGLPLDRSDVRVKHADGLSGSVSAFVDRVRSGDLGALPVAVGLVLIWAVFTSLNPVFVSPDNLVNLLFDCSTTGVIALGIVCVLMVGEIDLSVGSISGLASALVGVLWVNQGWPVGLAILAVLACGVAIGALYALLFNRLGMPSFVATLAGLLAILGLQLYLLGSSGSINLPYDTDLVDFGQQMVLPAVASHLLALLPGVVMLVVGLRNRQRRLAVHLSAPSTAGLLVKAVVLTVALQAVVLYLGRGRGVPLMFALFLLVALVMDYALRRTRWGRSMQAVGGNQEAARRAGIPVRRIFASAFVLCATFAALGGTSLFGGRGSAWSAVLGIIVIQSIASGLTLLNLSSSLRFMITGAVLAIAVIVDSMARRSRVSHGRA